MFATAQVISELDPSVLLVPDMSVLRSGERNTVFVEVEAGKFQPRSVKLGPRAESDNNQVISGLKEGERVVTSGQFMLDSESQLREAIQKMQGASERQSVERDTVARASTLNAASASRSADVKYICPMPEHVSIEDDHPGKCPICGMILVPVTEATLKKLQPGGKLLYYTCPMPEHNDVHSESPAIARNAA